jgi:hypothetical protein
MSKQKQRSDRTSSNQLAPRSSDEFFASRTPVTRVQFWGLLALGLNIVILTIFVALVSFKRLFAEEVGILELVAAVAFGLAFSCFAYVGVTYILRAFNRSARKRTVFK